MINKNQYWKYENLNLLNYIKSNFKKQYEIIKNNPQLPQQFILFLNTPCFNDCIFCNNKKTRFDASDCELNNYIQQIKLNKKYRIRHISLGGNDPLAHPDIFEIVRESKKNYFQNIEVMTSGNNLGDEHFVDLLINSGVNIFSLPLYGSKAEIHDKIVRKKGNFAEIIKGIDLIKEVENTKIFIHTLLLKQNIKDINNIIKLVEDSLGLPFTIMPVRCKTGIQFKKICPTYSEILKNVKRGALLDFPLCISQKVNKDSELEPRNISNSVKVYSLIQQHEKTNKCNLCNLKERCNGPLKSYLDYFGDKELSPIK